MTSKMQSTAARLCGNFSAETELARRIVFGVGMGGGVVAGFGLVLLMGVSHYNGPAQMIVLGERRWTQPNFF